MVALELADLLIVAARMALLWATAFHKVPVSRAGY